jgi:hypothetical protein
MRHGEWALFSSGRGEVPEPHRSDGGGPQPVSPNVEASEARRLHHVGHGYGASMVMRFGLVVLAAVGVAADAGVVELQSPTTSAYDAYASHAREAFLARGRASSRPGAASSDGRPGAGNEAARRPYR